MPPTRPPSSQTRRRPLADVAGPTSDEDAPGQAAQRPYSRVDRRSRKTTVERMTATVDLGVIDISSDDECPAKGGRTLQEQQGRMSEGAEVRPRLDMCIHAL